MKNSYSGIKVDGCCKAFALTGRMAACCVPRALPWARSFCPFRACGATCEILFWACSGILRHPWFTKKGLSSPIICGICVTLNPNQESVWICEICGTKNNVTFGGLSSIVLKKGAFQNLPSRWRWGWKSILSWGLGLRFRGWMGYECTVVNLRPYSYIVYARTLVALRPYTCRVFNRTLVEKWMFFEFFTFC